MKELIVTTNEAGLSLLKFLNRHLKEAPNSFLYKMLRKKNITLNAKKATGKEKLLAGDFVNIFLSDETYNKFSGQMYQSSQTDPAFLQLQELAKKHAYKALPIIYEDEHIAVANKPWGMLSQKASANDISANELFLAYLIATDQLTKEQFHMVHPSVCNRLDRNTSGLLLCGKTIQGLQQLSLDLKERRLHKYYICLVKGKITAPMEVTGYLTKDEARNTVSITDEPIDGGKYIKTVYEPLAYNHNITKLKVHLITGRSHQIRAHLSYLGHPILGDPKYGDESMNRMLYQKYGLNHQLLHAYEMIFEDGRHLFAPLPELFDIICPEEKLCQHGIPED